MRLSTKLLLLLSLLCLTAGDIFAQQAWIWQNPLPRIGSLGDVAFTDTSTGTIVGSGIWRTTDGGRNWTAQSRPTAAFLSSVCFTSSSIGTAVGDSGVILRTTNGGTTWTRQTSGVTTRLTGVHFADSNVGMAVGAGGRVLRTTNGGTSWSTVSSGITANLEDIFLIGPDTATFVGEAVIRRTTNGGTSWTPQNPRLLEFVNAVHFTDANNGSAAGSDGYVLRTTNGGTNWTLSQLPSGLGIDLFDVVFTTDSIGIVAGRYGIIARTTNNGTTWTRTLPRAPNTFLGLAFPSRDIGVAVGGDGLMARTVDGGATWKLMGEVTAEILQGVSFTSSTVGTTVGELGTIVRTVTGGASWTLQSSGTTHPLRAVDFSDSATGTAVGDTGTILRTTNGGASWSTQSSGGTARLNGVSFVGTAIGTAVGDSGRILRTTNGGATWTRQTSGATVTLNGVSFTHPDTGTVVGNFGWILQTVNGGTTWTRQTSGVSRMLLGVSFIDGSTGVAVGESGTILRTTNGGATWTNQTGTNTTRFRSVSFVSVDTGYIVGDAGAIRRTVNGGTTWTTQTSGTTRTLYSVSAVNDTTATAVGELGVILRSSAPPGGTTPPVVSLVLTSFNTGSFAAGSTQTITWTSTNVDTVAIDLSANGGVTYPTVIAAAVPAAAGSYQWTIPEILPPGSNYRVRIRDRRTGLVGDTSSASFTITPPPTGPKSLSLTSFNSGSYQAGTMQSITWTSANVDVVTIELSSDSGATFSRILAENTSAATGSYAWTIPASLAPGSGYRIRIRDGNSAGVADTSSANFTITAPPAPDVATITLTSFNGGSYQAGDTASITWTSENVDSVAIELLGSVSEEARTIVAGIPASNGSYLWTIPSGQTSGTHRIRIRDIDDPAVTDSSDAEFTITAIPLGVERQSAGASTGWTLSGVYPNPVVPEVATVRIDARKDTRVSVRLVSMLGEEIWHRDGVALRNGSNLIELPAAALVSNGTYRLIVSSPDATGAVTIVVRR